MPRMITAIAWYRCGTGRPGYRRSVEVFRTGPGKAAAI